MSDRKEAMEQVKRMVRGTAETEDHSPDQCERPNEEATEPVSRAGLESSSTPNATISPVRTTVGDEPEPDPIPADAKNNDMPEELDTQGPVRRSRRPRPRSSRKAVDSVGPPVCNAETTQDAGEFERTESAPVKATGQVDNDVTREAVGSVNVHPANDGAWTSGRRALAREIRDLEKMVQSGAPETDAIEWIASMLDEAGYFRTAAELRSESSGSAHQPASHQCSGEGVIVSQEDAAGRREQLRELLETRQFVAAWSLARPYAEALKNKPSVSVADGNLINSVDELMYLLTKFQYLWLIETGEHRRASELLASAIRTHVTREITLGGDRAAAASHDIRWLQELAGADGGRATVSSVAFGSGVLSRNNPYAGWTWDAGLRGFWGDEGGRSGTAHMLGLEALFPAATHTAEFRSKKHQPAMTGAEMDDGKTGRARLADTFAAVRFRTRVRELVAHEETGDGDGGGLRALGAGVAVARRRKDANGRTGGRGKTEAGRVAAGGGVSRSAMATPEPKPKGDSEGAHDAVVSQVTANEGRVSPRRKLPAIAPAAEERGAPGKARRGSMPAAAVADASPTRAARSENRTSRLGSAARGDMEDADRKSTSQPSAFGAVVPSSEVEKLMPPPSREHETADFALAATSGPTVGRVRALDVTFQAAGNGGRDGRVIVATSGGDERSERRISVWDGRTGGLVGQLEHGSHKPVVALAFHPGRPGLLLSADMEFGVKLWDWEAGQLVRAWKKHHSRIVWRLSFVPGHEWRAASCSGDQSLKLWETDEEKPVISGIYANEPFTSFVFCGDVAGQTLIASLSYSIRIYKMRTLSLIHTIQLKELKMNKTPISFLCSHPIVDQVVLLSCDNQLRMLHLGAETTLRVFSARELAPGTRIEGRFSPCGTFVYSGTWDARSFSTATPRGGRASLGGGSSGRGLEGKSGFHGVEASSAGEDAAASSGAGGGGAEAEASGVYVWRVSSGRLERAEMKAMQMYARSTDGRQQQQQLGRTPVSLCRWIRFTDGSYRERKLLLAAGLDRCLRTYM
ncbi:hypothetical protein HK405_012206 [Cladochytrium tenue]|nr:hypothetical protein HK405_012206 [Cladochytrium tenue]